MCLYNVRYFDKGTVSKLLFYFTSGGSYKSQTFILIIDFPYQDSMFGSSLLLVFFLCLFLVPMFGAIPWGGPLLPVPPGESCFAHG